MVCTTYLQGVTTVASLSRQQVWATPMGQSQVRLRRELTSVYQKQRNYRQLSFSESKGCTNVCCVRRAKFDSCASEPSSRLQQVRSSSASVFWTFGGQCSCFVYECMPLKPIPYSSDKKDLKFAHYRPQYPKLVPPKRVVTLRQVLQGLRATQKLGHPSAQSRDPTLNRQGSLFLSGISLRVCLVPGASFIFYSSLPMPL
jgi:hypothetical protein